MRPDELERRLQERLDALGPMARHALLTVLLLPDSERAAEIGELYGQPATKTLAELLIDCEEDRTLRSFGACVGRSLPRQSAGTGGWLHVVAASAAT